MIEIFFQGANVVQTVLFLVIVLYWLIVLFGALDFDTFDFDVDIDTDVDVDADLDADTDGDSSNVFGLNKILHFFNLGRVPFMVFLTFLILPWWFGSIIVNHWLGIESFIPALIVILPMLILSLFVAKFLTMPFVKIFEALDKENIERDILGTIGTVRIAASNVKTGQGEFKLGDAYLNINIRTKEGEVSIGEKVMIVNDRNKNEYYVVERQVEI